MRRLQEENERLKQQPTSSGSEDEPQRDKFDSWDEYDRARVRWLARQEVRQETQAMREAETQRVREAQAAELRAAWEARLDSARDEHDDIDEYVDVVGERINEVLAVAIQTSDVGPALVRYLGQNPKELDRITSLPGVAAVRELGRLESRLQARPKPSNAPSPASTVKTVDAPKNALRDDMPIDAWMKARTAQVRG